VGPAPAIRRWVAMGVRTRGLDIAIGAKRQAADAAARAEAQAVIERWNEQLVASRDILWSPTIRAALIAGTPWLDVLCPGCGTSRAIDLRKVDVIRSRRSPSSCWGCGARGARNQRPCRGSSDCTPCHLRQRQRRRTCERRAMVATARHTAGISFRRLGSRTTRSRPHSSSPGFGTVSLL
jgi:hypothetical protein